MTIELTDKFRLAEDVFYFSLGPILTFLVRDSAKYDGFIPDGTEITRKDLERHLAESGSGIEFRWYGLLIKNQGETVQVICGPSDFTALAITKGHSLGAIAKKIPDFFALCPPLEVIETTILEQVERWSAIGLVEKVTTRHPRRKGGE